MSILARIKHAGPILIVLVPFTLIEIWMLRTLDPTAFQRAGSIGVVVGILIFARMVSKWSTQVRKLENLQNEIVSFKTSQDELGDIANAEALELETNTTMDQLRLERKSLGFIETTVLVVSTLQWGFGDLFVCWFNGFGWKVCY